MRTLPDQDLELARRLLQTSGAKVVAVKEGRVLAVGHGAHILPLYLLVRGLGDQLAGARVAGAFGEVVSAGAYQILAAHGCHLEWTKLVPAILTPTGTSCPMESLVADTEDPGEAFRHVWEVLEPLSGAPCSRKR